MIHHDNCSPKNNILGYVCNNCNLQIKNKKEILIIFHNEIEARQWIVARHLSCYNPMSCFTPLCGVKYDKIKFHEFFCVCNFFSFSPLSLSPTLSLYLSFSLSHPISLSLPLLSLSFSLPSLSLFLSFFPTPASLSVFLSPIPVVSLSNSHSCLPVYLSLTPVSPSPSPWLSLSLPPPVSLPIFLSPTMPLFFLCSLSLSPSKEREHKIIL